MTSRPEIHAVILAGGSGTRFWPASRRLRPKQVLPLGPCAPQSLIASTVDRLRGLVEEDRILVATGAHLVEATQAELPELPASAFLAEPQARNTAPCIGWAASVVARKNPDAIVCVLPSDQHATDTEGFRRALTRAAEAAQTGAITTIGILPTRPDTGYGYIQQGPAQAEGVFEVARFVEKPDRSTAEQYLKSGDYVWNAGIFVFRAGDMLAAFRKHLPEMATGLDGIEIAAQRGAEAEASAVTAFFRDCESISIDYGIMEKETNLSVVPAEFGWSDLGSWESSWDLSPKDDAGNAAPASTILVDAKNNLVEDLRSATKDKRVIALVGVEGLCVVETDDALLIMPTSRSQDVREVVAELKSSERSDLT